MSQNHPNVDSKRSQTWNRKTCKLYTQLGILSIQEDPKSFQSWNNAKYGPGDIQKKQIFLRYKKLAKVQMFHKNKMLCLKNTISKRKVNAFYRGNGMLFVSW
jgi:hypothetical protein